ncbi:MAG: dipeptidase [Actinomycetaceae bacterium]|nr:dipeptidase [Arcanobacterium sp.]MDD7505407.1 dipeptidase [Actinomycetaceae bacterium]MDY6143544.1 dipeptidase [Arcanobacterium sp.]
MNTTTDIRSRVEAQFQSSVNSLIDLVAIPSVSADSFDQSTLETSAQWIAQKFSALGFDTEVIHHVTPDGLQGRPAILAHREGEEGKPTVLLYAHHDVQPQGDEALWHTDPYRAQRIGERLYGRGAADDKAGVMLHIAAIEAADPGVGITVFIEGEEEIGSPTFASFLETYKDRLAADVIVVADSSNWKVGTPSLTTSLRGVVTLDVTIKVLDHALHSGMYSGPVLDAVTIASRLITTLHDDAGEVAVDGLLGSNDTDVDYPEDELRQDMGILPGVELAGSGSLTSRLWMKPTITVIGMDVTSVARASNTLLPEVTFSLSLRVAPMQDPAQAAAAVKRHLESHVPFGAHIAVTITDQGPGFISDGNTETTHIAKWALGEAWGTEPVDIGVGGSIPFISDFKRVIPQAQILVTGVEDPDSRAHSANESLHLGDWQNAIVAEALLLSKLGE